MAQSTSGTSSTRRHARGEQQDTASVGSSRFADAEWEAKEALRQRELEEARARAAQMEKTMRWWSDCTANWREKWSKVRTERNKAREEAKQLRSKLESALKDVNSYKREKREFEVQNEQLKKEIEKIHLLLLKHAGQFDGKIFEVLGDDLSKEVNFSAESEVKVHNELLIDADVAKCDSTASSVLDLGAEVCMEEYILQGAVPKRSSDADQNIKDIVTNGFDFKSENLLQKNVDEYEQEFIGQKLSMLQLRLEEATKTVQVEREEKLLLHRSIEKLTGELQEAKDKCDELRQAKQDTVRELLSLQDVHKEEVKMIRADLQDEASSREGTDRRLNDLRTELERLQAENAAEWGRRERLETEKIAMERENKKLRSELRDMQERMEKRGRPVTNADVQLRQLEQELSDKIKEIADLKHTQIKLKKMTQDKITELAHTARRAEQYEAEVKKLRHRVEELKRDLAVAEDELDTASNNVRKLQRTNDELQEQVENFEVQLQHLHSRLRNSSSSSLLQHRGSLLAEDGSDEDLNDEY